MLAGGRSGVHNWFPTIISRTARRSSMKFGTCVPQQDVPTCIDFGVAPTTATPSSGHFVSKSGDIHFRRLFGERFGGIQ